MGYIRTNLPKKKKKAKGPVCKKFKTEFREWKPKTESRYQAADHKNIPSAIDRFLAETNPEISKGAVRYEGEMAERERAAQAEIEKKKKCVAPAYNKGAYTFIASEEQAKWVGRK